MSTKADMMGHDFNPSTQEPEKDGSLWVWGQPGLQSDLQNSQGYTEKPCFKKQNKTKKCEDYTWSGQYFLVAGEQALQSKNAFPEGSYSLEKGS